MRMKDEKIIPEIIYDVFGVGKFETRAISNYSYRTQNYQVRMYEVYE